MISNNQLNNIFKNIQTDIRKLENPIELRTNRNSIVFIYPAITNNITSKDDMEILRKFFAISMLKEINISNLIVDIDNLLSMDEVLQKKQQDIINQLGSSIQLTGTTNSISAYYAYHLISSEQEKISRKSKNISKKILTIIEKDPYYQQYKAMVDFKSVGNVYIPMVIGTKEFQVDAYVFLIILYIALSLNIPLNSLENIHKLESFLRRKEVRELLMELKYFNPYDINIFEKLEEHLKQFASQIKTKAFKLSDQFDVFIKMILVKLKRDISTRYQKLKYLLPSTKMLFTGAERIYQLAKGIFTIFYTFAKTFYDNYSDKSILSGKEYTLIKHYPNIHEYQQYLNNEFEKAFLILKLCTNIFYYTSQLNDRFSEFVVSVFKKDAKVNLLKRYEDIFNEIFTNEIAKDISTKIYNEVKNKALNIDDKDIEKFITDNIDELIHVRNNLRDKYRIQDIKLVHINTLLDFIRKNVVDLFNYYDEKIRTRIKHHDISSESELILKYLRDLFLHYSPSEYLIKIMGQNIDNFTGIDLIYYFFNKYFSNDEVSIKQIIDNDEIFKEILIKVGFEIDYNKKINRKIFKHLKNFLVSIIGPVEVILKDYVNNEIDGIINNNYEIIGRILEDLYLNDEKNVIKNIIPKTKITIQKFVSAYVFVIMFRMLFEYIDVFVNSINVDKITIDEENVQKVLQFPNYILILPEEILKPLATAILISKDVNPKEAFEKTYITDFNPKYFVEYLIDRLKMPAIITVSKKGRVVYKFHYMKKPEKTNIRKIEEFLKEYMRSRI